LFVVIQIYTISSVVFFFFATIFYLSLHFSEEPQLNDDYAVFLIKSTHYRAFGRNGP